MILGAKQNWFGFFYDFSMIYYEFPSIQPIIKITKHQKRKQKLLGPEAAQLGLVN